MPNSEMIKNDRFENLVQSVKSIYKKINAYFIVICFLFISIVIIGCNYCRLYQVQYDLRNELTSVLVEIQGINNINHDLSTNLSELQDQYNRLKSINSELASKENENSAAMMQLIKDNDELNKKNRELSDDNSQFQNSLKMAASDGVKPQNYTSYKSMNSRGTGLLDRGNYIGRFVGTAYTPTAEDCGNNYGITNSGLPVVPGVTIAVDKKYWPFGTVFYIKGLGYTVAMDTGSAIKGKYRFDFAVLNKDFADKFGMRKWDVYLVKMGTGKIDSILF